MFSWMPTCDAWTPRAFSELCAVFSNSTSISDVFFLYFGKKGTTHNCLVHRPWKTVTGWTAVTRRSWHWKIGMGNFIVRSENELSGLLSEMTSTGPVKAFTFSQTKRKIKKERKEIVGTKMKAKCHHNEAWLNSPQPHPKKKAPRPPSLAISAHGQKCYDTYTNAFW